MCPLNQQLFNQADLAISENAFGPNRHREITRKIAKCAAAHSNEIRWQNFAGEIHCDERIKSPGVSGALGNVMINIHLMLGKTMF